MVSFIIYYHSSRIENLRQTIRLLEERESKLIRNSELILICQNQSPEISTNFLNTKLINLNLNTYMKPRMCNIGVSLANNEKIILLDSDRILPYAYFQRNIHLLSQGTTITTEPLYKLKADYSDEQIKTNKILKIADFRSKHNTLRFKNMFSGNTMFLKSDYMKCGGMDEQFIGYGYADNDMTENMSQNGCSQIFLQEPELHLCHAKSFEWFGKQLSQESFKAISASNAAIFVSKWKKEPDKCFWKIVSEVLESKLPTQDKLNFFKLINTLFIKNI